jgi:hypothetical protein
LGLWFCIQPALDRHCRRQTLNWQRRGATFGRRWWCATIDAKRDSATLGRKCWCAAFDCQPAERLKREPIIFG